MTYDGAPWLTSFLRRAFDTGTDAIWNSINKGVSLLYPPGASLDSLDNSGNGRISSRSTYRNRKMKTEEMRTSEESASFERTLAVNTMLVLKEMHATIRLYTSCTYSLTPRI